MAEQDEPETTGLWVHDNRRAGRGRFEVRFAFSGERWFDSEADATAATVEYETALRAELLPELAEYVPCQACGWDKPRAPSNAEELPIVRGALDAQEAAEKGGIGDRDRAEIARILSSHIDDCILYNCETEAENARRLHALLTSPHKNETSE